MAEVNNGIALAVNPPGGGQGGGGIQYPDITRSLSMLAQMQMAGAHAGLYTLEAAKQAMTLQGLSAYQQRVASGEAPESAVGSLWAVPEMQKQVLDAAQSGITLAGNRQFAQTGNVGALKGTPLEYAGVTRDLSSANLSNQEATLRRADVIGRIAGAAGGIDETDPQANAKWSALWTAAANAGAIDRKTADAFSRTGFDKALVGRLQLVGMGAQQQQEVTGQAAAAQAAARFPETAATKAMDVQAALASRQGGEVTPVMTGANAYMAARNAGPTAAVTPNTEQAVLSNIATAAAGVPAGQQRADMVNARLSAAVNAGSISKDTAGRLYDSVRTDDDLKALTTAPPAAQGGPSMVAKTPGQVEEEKGQGTQLAEMPGKLRQDADSAVVERTYIQNMLDHAQSWSMGKWANVEYEARMQLKGLAQMFGQDTTKYDTPLSDFEAFRKDAMQLVRQNVRDTSARAAVQEFKMISTASPQVDMTPRGLQVLGAQIKGIEAFKIAKQKAGAAWAAAHNGSYAGFDEDWNQNASPDAFYLHELPTDIKKDTLKNIAAGNRGEARIGELHRQLQWLDQRGLGGP